MTACRSKMSCLHRITVEVFQSECLSTCREACLNHDRLDWLDLPPFLSMMQAHHSMVTMVLWSKMSYWNNKGIDP
jgi:hypothetical protein